MAVRVATPALRADKDVALAAVASYGNSLNYVDPRFRSDMDVVLVAAKQDLRSLKLGDPKLFEREDFRLSAFECVKSMSVPDLLCDSGTACLVALVWLNAVL